jgi:hypothetical protein
MGLRLGDLFPPGNNGDGRAPGVAMQQHAPVVT